MDTGSVEVGQNLNRLQGISSALAMNRVVGEGLRRGGMHPPPLPLDIEASFIMMEHLCLSSGLLGLLFNSPQLLGTARGPSAKRCHPNRPPEQIREQFTGSLIGQQLVLDQIHPKRCDVSSILDGGLHILRERSLRDRRAVRTAFALGLVFDHHGSLDRQMDHLSAFLPQALHLFVRPPDNAHSVLLHG